MSGKRNPTLSAQTRRIYSNICIIYPSKEKKKGKKDNPDKQKGSNPKAQNEDAKRQLATQVKTMCARRINFRKVLKENKR